jgi:hypothetical protein
MAAAPTFALMALLTIVGEGGRSTLCSTAHGSPLSGMALMYLLMGAFHSSPWFRLTSRRMSEPQSGTASNRSATRS